MITLGEECGEIKAENIQQKNFFFFFFLIMFSTVSVK